MAVSISAVIPAFNEERTVGDVVRVLVGAGIFREVIVVDDGSSDATSEMAELSGAVVIRLPVNSGKGGAMVAGVRSATSPYVCFFDADLTGLKTEHARSLVGPVANGEADMCIGTVDRGRRLNVMASLLPAVSGQRVFRRELFEAIPVSALQGFGAETAINRYAAIRGLKVRRIFLRGVGNVRKTRKFGLARGTVRYLMMLKDMLRAWRFDG